MWGLNPLLPREKLWILGFSLVVGCQVRVGFMARLWPSCLDSFLLICLMNSCQSANFQFLKEEIIPY